jgi:ribonuclease HI
MSQNKFKIYAYCDGLCEPQNGQLGQGPMDIGYWARTEDNDVLFAQHEIVRNDNGKTITGTCNQAEYYGLLRLHRRLAAWKTEIMLDLEPYLVKQQEYYDQNPEWDTNGDAIPWGYRQVAMHTALWKKQTKVRDQLSNGIELHIHSDSQIMVHQLDGQPYRDEGVKPWKVRDTGLKALVFRANIIREELPYTLHKISRETNGMADSLAQNRVLKGSARARQMEEGRFQIKQHTPCAEFIRGENPFILMKSDFPEKKDAIIEAIQERGNWDTIETLYIEMKEILSNLRDRTPSLNALVDSWVANTFSELEQVVLEWEEAIATRNYETCDMAIVDYFEHYKSTIGHSVDTTGVESESTGSVVNDNWFCSRKKNQRKKEHFESVPEFEAFEQSRDTAYESEMETASASESFSFDGVFDDAY